MDKNNTHYDAENIRVLEGLEAVRLRPGMYIGSTGTKGFHHLIYEVVDNSIDEALAGRCDHIEVTLHVDGSVSIEDNGPGIPVAKHKQTGISTLETVLTILHAGGKFDNNAYKVSGGLHGVGVSVVNALSEELTATVKRDGKIYEQRFARGKKGSELTVMGEVDPEDTGTKIRFTPDMTIFDDGLEFEWEVLEARFREMAFLNSVVTIRLADERTGKEETFHYEGGIKEFVKYINRNKTAIHPEIIYFEDTRDGINVQLAMQYFDGYSENVLTFANNIHTGEGGYHLSGFRAALTRSINDYGRNFNLIKENEANLTGDDVREGLTAILSVKLSNPQFEGQTKAKLGNSEVQGVVQGIVSEDLARFLEENPKTAKSIIDKAVRAARAREAAKKVRDITRKSNFLENTSLPGKLADCSSKDVNETEIYLVEGDSAGGSAKSGRDRNFQAILPLRGKIMNVEKARIDRVLGFEEIRSMITAFGTGIGEEFDISGLRYGKIIIMTDADVDGAHIRTLLLTFFYRYMRPLVEEGHVYIAQPPLYHIVKNRKDYYAYNDEELEQVLDEIGRGNHLISRYKGLGEMDAEQLWSTTMDPEKRVLLQVTVEEEVAADEIFTILMGDKVEPRRQFIEENARYAENIDA